MTDEKHPWEQLEGEPSRWFQRFSAFRVMGPGRTVKGAEDAERATAGKIGQKNYTSGAWSRAVEKWNWRARADAWDRWVIEQADAKWKAEMMGEAELLGRLSQMARGNIHEFVELNNDGQIFSVKIDELERRGYMVRKISTSKKTDSVSVEMYDAQEAMAMIGKHLKLFTNQVDVTSGGEPLTVKVIKGVSMDDL